MVLTEDSGAGAYDTVHALAKEMFKLLVPGVRTDRIDFKPLKDENARRAMRGTDWKSTNPLDQPNIRLLIRSIITELLKDDGFVLYHIDGDRPWSEHNSSENVREFHSRILPPIEAGVRTYFQRQSHASEVPGERMKRFCLLVPFYSIEAWVYQNIREARRLCEETGCKRCHEKLADWEKNRASLDEVIKPKAELCFKDKHNAHLASSGFPAQEVYDAKASFEHAVMKLLECDELTALLERTYAPVEPQSP